MIYFRKERSLCCLTMILLKAFINASDEQRLALVSSSFEPTVDSSLTNEYYLHMSSLEEPYFQCFLYLKQLSQKAVSFQRSKDEQLPILTLNPIKYQNRFIYKVTFLGHEASLGQNLNVLVDVEQKSENQGVLSIFKFVIAHKDFESENFVTDHFLTFTNFTTFQIFEPNIKIEQSDLLNEKPLDVFDIIELSTILESNEIKPELSVAAADEQQNLDLEASKYVDYQVFLSAMKVVFKKSKVYSLNASKKVQSLFYKAKIFCFEEFQLKKNILEAASQPNENNMPFPCAFEITDFDDYDMSNAFKSLQSSFLSKHNSKNLTNFNSKIFKSSSMLVKGKHFFKDWFEDVFTKFIYKEEKCTFSKINVFLRFGEDTHKNAKAIHGDHFIENMNKILQSLFSADFENIEMEKTTYISSFYKIFVNLNAMIFSSNLLKNCSTAFNFEGFENKYLWDKKVPTEGFEKIKQVAESMIKETDRWFDESPSGVHNLLASIYKDLNKKPQTLINQKILLIFKEIAMKFNNLAFVGIMKELEKSIYKSELLPEGAGEILKDLVQEMCVDFFTNSSIDKNKSKKPALLTLLTLENSENILDLFAKLDNSLRQKLKEKNVGQSFKANEISIDGIAKMGYFALYSTILVNVLGLNTNFLIYSSFLEKIIQLFVTAKEKQSDQYFVDQFFYKLSTEFIFAGINTIKTGIKDEKIIQNNFKGFIVICEHLFSIGLTLEKAEIDQYSVFINDPKLFLKNLAKKIFQCESINED